MIKHWFKFIWWALITLLAFPLFYPVLLIARTSELLGETMHLFFDWLCEKKHKLAPYPLTDESEARIKAAADDDL